MLTPEVMVVDLVEIVDGTETKQSDAEVLRAKRCSEFAATAIICAGCPMVQFCGSRVETPSETPEAINVVDSSVGSPVFEQFKTASVNLDVIEDSLNRESVNSKTIAKESTFSAPEKNQILKPSAPEKDWTPNRPYLEQLLDDTVLTVVANSFEATSGPAQPDTRSQVIEIIAVPEPTGGDVVVVQTPEFIDMSTDVTAVVDIRPKPEVTVLSTPQSIAESIPVILPELIAAVEYVAIETDTPDLTIEAADVLLIPPVVTTTETFKPLPTKIVTEADILAPVDTDESEKIKPIITPSGMVQYVPEIEVALSPVATIEDIVIVQNITRSEPESREELTVATESITAPLETVIVREEVMETLVPLVQEVVLSEIVDLPQEVEVTDELDSPSIPFPEAIDAPSDELVTGVIKDLENDEYQLEQAVNELNDISYARGHTYDTEVSVSGELREVLDVPLIDSDTIDPEFRLTNLAAQHHLAIQILHNLASQALRGLIILSKHSRTYSR